MISTGEGRPVHLSLFSLTQQDSGAAHVAKLRIGVLRLGVVLPDGIFFVVIIFIDLVVVVVVGCRRNPAEGSRALTSDVKTTFGISVSTSPKLHGVVTITPYVV